MKTDDKNKMSNESLSEKENKEKESIDEDCVFSDGTIDTDFFEEDLLDAIEAGGNHPMFLTKEESLKMIRDLKKKINIKPKQNDE